MTTLEIFSKRTKKLIEENETTIYKIAKELELNKTSLANWINGRNEPTITTLKLLADYFSVSSDYLIGKQDW